MPDERVLLVGARSMEDEERELMSQSGIQLVAPSEMAGEAGVLVQALDRLVSDVGSVHLHVDLDVIDLADGRANEYAAGGGRRPCPIFIAPFEPSARRVASTA